MMKVAHDHSKMSHTTSFRATSSRYPFSQISDSKQWLLHQVAHDLNPKGRLWDLVVALDIKLHSRTSLLIADDMASRRTRPQTTSRHIAADIQLRPASQHTRHEVHPLMSHTTFPLRSSPVQHHNKPQKTNRTRRLNTCRVRAIMLLV